MTRPLLTIVIANYNYGRYLEEAIRSVISQDVDNLVELIICDAASTDNSLEIIRKYAKGLPPNTEAQTFVSKNAVSDMPIVSWWCSEKDGGQSAAFNKGFSHAKGEWLTWLNADDILMPGTLKAFERLVTKKTNAEWVTGNKVHFNSDTREILSVHWGPHLQPPFLHGSRAFCAVFGPTTFWRKSLQERVGLIDEKLHYAMDTEYWARFTMAGIKQIRLNHICWGFRVHNASKTEGIQSESIRRARAAETAYWQDKTHYRFDKSWRNPYYVCWVLWRVIDCSWIVRLFLKLRFERKSLATLVNYQLDNSDV